MTAVSPSPAGDQPARALFLPSADSSLKEMLYVARQMRATNRFECTFLVAHASQDRWLAAIQDSGHSLIQTKHSRRVSGRSVPRTCDEDEGRRRSFLRRCASAAKQAIRFGSQWLLLDSLARYHRYRRGLARTVADAQAFLDQVRPHVLILANDRSIGLETALISQARDREIPSIVIPWCLWTPRCEMFGRTHRPGIYAKLRLRGVANRFAGWRFPDHLLHEGSEPLLSSRGEMLLAASSLNLLARNPFRYFGCGNATRVAVESPWAREMCLSRGIPAEKLVLTGRPYSDVVHRNLLQREQPRAALAQEFGFDSDARIIVCAVPNTGEQGLCSWDQHWHDTRNLFDALASLERANVVLNLHPKSAIETYQGIAAQYGFALSRDPIEELIPASDLFVSTFSSTIMTAIGCGIPVVNLDIYGADCGTFDNCAGIITVRDRRQIATSLDMIWGNETRYRQYVSAQQEAASYWGQVDGRCTARLIAEIENLAILPSAARRAA